MKVYIDYDGHPDLASQQRIYDTNDGNVLPNEILVGKRITSVEFRGNDDKLYFDVV